MKASRISNVLITIALGCVVTANVFAGDKARKKATAHCFDAAFHERTGRLFVAGSNTGTHVFEVTDGKLRFTTTISDGVYHRNLKISGDRLYVADAFEGLLVFDISAEVPVCTWKQKEPDVAGLGIYVHENHAYLAAGPEGLYIFDISTPDSPKTVGKCRTNDDAWDVWVSGKYAYVADFQKGVTVVDVSQPARPEKLSWVTWEENRPTAEIIRGEGGIVCVAAGGHGLVVVDVGNPRHPKVVGRYKSDPKSYGEGLCVRNGLVYLANLSSNKDKNGLIIIDAHNPGSLEVKGKCLFDDGVEGVCLAGNRAFVTNRDSGVRSIDVSNPGNPWLVDSSGPIESERLVASDTLPRSEVSRREREIIEYLKNTKRQIHQGRKFNDWSTAAKAFLTFISALRHRDQSALEKVFPMAGHEQLKKRLASPEQLSRILDFVERSTVCRVSLEHKSPQGSLCAIYTSASPDKEIDQALLFGYVEGEWRFVGSTSEIDSWLQAAASGAEITGKVLRQDEL